jgi:hypothetical protein
MSCNLLSPCCALDHNGCKKNMVNGLIEHDHLLIISAHRVKMADCSGLIKPDRKIAKLRGMSVPICEYTVYRVYQEDN